MRRSHQRSEGQPEARRRAAVLVPLALCLMAGSPLGLRVPASVSSGPLRGGLDHAGLVAILVDRNPQLLDVQRTRIATAVLRYSAKYELDPGLVTAVLLVESGARPWARSRKGAMGLMQIMPHMMEPLGLVGNAATIESNVEAGCWILADNIRRLGEERGISAYFWGSRILGDSYLERVQEARVALQEQIRS